MTHSQIVAALQILRPGAQWSLDGETYANLRWFDSVQTKPTENEIKTIDAEAKSNAFTASARNGAIAQLLSDSGSSAKFMRAMLLVILDEINTIRSLLPVPPAPRTANQFKTAVQAKINSGASD